MPAQTCLLLKLSDNRHFFTHETNFPLLIEFSRVAGAEVSLVKTQDAKILEIEELAKKICTHVGNEHPAYEVLERRVLPTDLPEKKMSAQMSQEINLHITAEMLTGKVVKKADLCSKWPDVEAVAMTKHFARVRRQLEGEGYSVEKLRPGEYQVASNRYHDYQGEFV